MTAGGALAWGFAEIATRLLGNWAQIEASLAPDKTVLLFTLGILAIAALLFGLAPMRVAIAGGAVLVVEDVSGYIQYGCRQIAYRQSDCGSADGAVLGTDPGGRRDC